MSTLRPAKSLVRLVSFIVKHYAPNWFWIKSHPACTSGAKNLFRQIELTAMLPKGDRDVVEPVMFRNAFFAHPENLIISLLADENKSIRTRAVDIILKCRSKDVPEHTSVRSFAIPTHNFKEKLTGRTKASQSLL